MKNIYLYEIGIIMMFIKYTYDWHYVRCNLIEEFNNLCNLIYKNNLLNYRRSYNK